MIGYCFFLFSTVFKPGSKSGFQQNPSVACSLSACRRSFSGGSSKLILLSHPIVNQVCFDIPLQEFLCIPCLSAVIHTCSAILQSFKEPVFSLPEGSFFKFRFRAACQPSAFASGWCRNFFHPV
jgi:hypothetical protein